ncbi:MAG: methyltransferase [Flavobacteriaceae bacterium]|nr:methyltransferase [Flavobacteriaceae bacterium]|tara:strand:+ start:6824 stop:7465 length:642 start_codon:yes stop_codon:yes gene_type:complete
MEFIDESLLDYSVLHSSEEPSILKELRKETFQKILHPRMLSSPLQGRLLSFISKIINPELILEIGTYSGYGTLCLSEGLKKTGKIHTIDINEELISFQNKYFLKSSKRNQIIQHLGNALNIIQKIDGPFDIVFLDADKSNYINYMELVLPKIRRGGLLISDNVLWSGKVLKKANKDDLDTKILQDYNKLIKSNPKLETILLPIRDGLSLSRKL